MNAKLRKEVLDMFDCRVLDPPAFFRVLKASTEPVFPELCDELLILKVGRVVGRENVALNKPSAVVLSEGDLVTTSHFVGGGDQQPVRVRLNIEAKLARRQAI